MNTDGARWLTPEIKKRIDNSYELLEDAELWEPYHLVALLTTMLDNFEILVDSLATPAARQYVVTDSEQPADS